jgi:hypothetical protein
MKVDRKQFSIYSGLVFFVIPSISRQKKLRGDTLKQKDGKPTPWLRFFVLMILSLFVFLTGCSVTTKLVSPITYKEKLSQFSKQAVSTPYQTYPGERLSRNKTAVIAVSSNMMATDKEGIGIHNLSINNYKINYMENIDKRPQYYQLEILPGQNYLETIVQWLYKPLSYDDYIDTAKLNFNAKAGAVYFLQIYEKKPPKAKKTNAVLEFLLKDPDLEGMFYLAITYPLWFWAVHDGYDYVVPRCVWIWEAQTEQVVAGIAPEGWSNDKGLSIK